MDMTTGTQMIQDTHATLVARRAALALRVEEGDPAAVGALEDVEHELLVLELELGLTEERRALAVEARAERSQSEAQRAEEQRRTQLETKLAGLYRDRTRVAHEIDDLAGNLRTAIDTLVGIGRDMYVVTTELGEPRPRLGRLDGLITAAIGARLWPYGGSRLEASLRRPLAELLPLPDPEGRAA